MPFSRFLALIVLAAALLGSAKAKADEPPTYRAGTGNDLSEASRFVDDLLRNPPPWMDLRPVIMQLEPPLPPVAPNYLLTTRQLHRQRLSSNGQIPDELSGPPTLNGLDIEPIGLRFGPVEPNCMIGYSLSQQFLNPKVSRDARRVWALLHDDPFPISEPRSFGILRAVISPGLTRNFGPSNSLGIGLRLAPDKGLDTYCTNTAFVHRF